MKNNSQVWVGLIALERLPKNEILKKEHSGAYVNVLAWARNSSEYGIMIAKTVRRLKFRLLELSEVEPVLERAKRERLKKEISSLAKKVQQTKQIHFGTFYPYANIAHVK